MLITCYDMLSIKNFEAFYSIKNYSEARKVVYGFTFVLLAAIIRIWLNVSSGLIECINQLVLCI